MFASPKSKFAYAFVNAVLTANVPCCAELPVRLTPFDPFPALGVAPVFAPGKPAPAYNVLQSNQPLIELELSVPYCGKAI